MKQVLSLIVISITLYSCGSSTPESNTNRAANPSYDASADKKAIVEIEKRFADAALKGDSATVVAIYHTNAEVYPPNMSAGNRTVMGSLAVGLPKGGVTTFTMNSNDVSGNADQ